MKVYSIWGYGKFAVKDNKSGLILVFPISSSKLGFEPVVDEIENVNHNLVELLYGHRAYLEIETKEISQKGYKNYLRLISVLDTHNYDIYPFWMDTIPVQKQFCLSYTNYKMKEDDKLSIEQISKYLQVGQKLKLKFKAQKLVQTRPIINNDEDSWTTVGKHYPAYNRAITKNN